MTRHWRDLRARQALIRRYWHFKPRWLTSISAVDLEETP